MKITKSQRNNILFVVLIALFIIPQTRKPIQIVLQKVLASFSPSTIAVDDRKSISFDNWRLQDLSGNEINFKELEGKVVLLNFWATWCPPCIAEFPHIEALYEDYETKVAFVLVSNEKQEVVKAFLDKEKFNINSYTPLNQYPKGLHISSIPRTLLIDKNGNIVIDKTGAANWNSDKVRGQIDELLK